MRRKRREKDEREHILDSFNRRAQVQQQNSYHSNCVFEAVVSLIPLKNESAFVARGGHLVVDDDEGTLNTQHSFSVNFTVSMKLHDQLSSHYPSHISG